MNKNQTAREIIEGLDDIAQGADPFICGLPIKNKEWYPKMEAFVLSKLDHDHLPDDGKMVWYPVEYAGYWHLQSHPAYGGSDLLNADDVGEEEAKKNAELAAKAPVLATEYETMKEQNAIFSYENENLKNRIIELEAERTELILKLEIAKF